MFVSLLCAVASELLSTLLIPEARKCSELYFAIYCGLPTA